MNSLAMDLSSGQTGAEGASSHKSVLRLVLAVSLLLGPFVYLILRAANESFARGSQAPALIALCVIAFELAWLGYGFAVLVRKAID